MADLYSALKAFRSQKASQLGQPAFCIFTNAELDGLAAACPRTRADLARCKGFGPKRCEKFGDDILRICSSGLARPTAAASGSSLASQPMQSSASKRKLPWNPLAMSSGSTSARSKLADPGPPLPAAPPIPRSALNAEQAAAADRALSGSNLFLTGPAGVGKSYLLRFIIQELERRHPKAIAVTAPTGIAASHVQGQTIHSWAGIGLGKGSRDSLLQKVMNNHAACERWRKAEVLLLDEVSMLDSYLMEVLDMIGRSVRGEPAKAFGGLQIILCGDFFQLPPVSLGGNFGNGFAFQSRAWQYAGVSTVELKTVVRQQGDLNFIRLLNSVRIGLCSEATTAALAACHVDVKPPPQDGILPTKLYCKNANVDAENDARLASLGGEERAFPATDLFKGEVSSDAKQRLLEMVDKKAVGQLRLKLGAQVLLTKNRPDLRLVNGSRGVVTGFDESYVDGSYGVPSGRYMCAIVTFDTGQRLTVEPTSFFQGGPGGAVVRIAMPLRLAWALTVHKSQGMSLSRAELMLSDAFDVRARLLACRRARVRLPRAFVRLTHVASSHACCFVSMPPPSCQFGQVYVALSRVTSMGGLWIRGGRITQHVVKAHPDVLQFYQAVGCSVVHGGQ
jgi:ATP-dependent DNA helicase PIF1